MREKPLHSAGAGLYCVGLTDSTEFAGQTQPIALVLEPDAARSWKLESGHSWLWELAMAEPMPTSTHIPSRTREIPDKLYFRIGEVSRLCGVATSVLRFWETEFPQLKPNKGGTGQRLYRRRDVEMALRIKRLLYDEGYTIPGARQVFKAEQKQPTPMLALGLVAEPAPAVDLKKLKRLRRELEELHTLLARPLIVPKSARPKAAPPPTRLTSSIAPATPVAPASETMETTSAAEMLSDAEIHRLFDDPAL